jgi:hypothetical protein
MQIFLLNMPSSGLGCPSGSQPGARVPQDEVCGHDVASCKWKKITKPKIDSQRENDTKLN